MTRLQEKNDQICINLEKIRLGLKYRSDFDTATKNSKLPRIQTQSYTKSTKNCC